MPRDGFWIPPQFEQRLKVYAALAALAGAVVVGVALLAVFVSFSWPEADVGSPSARIYAGTADQFEVGQPVTFSEGKFHLVKQEDGSFIALYWRSPFRGCTVPWRENLIFADPETGTRKEGWFRDPCHGATFDLKGVRVFGPSPRNMDQLPVEIVGAKVYVLAAEQNLIRGQARDPILCTNPPEGGRVIPCAGR
jgi:nitrite reductase/ring-hydroxylating ferredoxin subunit